MKRILFASLLLIPNLAWGHVQLDEPLVRYSNANGEVNKSCPCGAGAFNRDCNVADISDPTRNEARVTTLTAGSTIRVTWRETVGHGGRYRVAFDADGADLSDFDAQILADVPDPEGEAGNAGNGNVWALDVTLPNTPCDNCTLQLVQVMDGDQVTPALDTRNRSSYYQCADLVLVAAAEGEGEGEGEGEPLGCACTSPRQVSFALSLLPLIGLVALCRRRR